MKRGEERLVEGSLARRLLDYSSRRGKGGARATAVLSCRPLVGRIEGGKSGFEVSWRRKRRGGGRSSRGDQRGGLKE